MIKTKEGGKRMKQIKTKKMEKKDLRQRRIKEGREKEIHTIKEDWNKVIMTRIEHGRGGGELEGRKDIKIKKKEGGTTTRN